MHKGLLDSRGASRKTRCNIKACKCKIQTGKRLVSILMLIHTWFIFKVLLWKTKRHLEKRKKIPESSENNVKMH